jgi:putative ABC transport system permease protein
VSSSVSHDHAPPATGGGCGGWLWLARRLLSYRVRRHALSTLLSSLIVALSVAVGLAVHYSSKASISSFERSAQSLIGSGNAVSLRSDRGFLEESVLTGWYRYLANEFHTLAIIERDGALFSPQTGRCEGVKFFAVDPLELATRRALSQGANGNVPGSTGARATGSAAASWQSREVLLSPDLQKRCGLQAGQNLQLSILGSTQPHTTLRATFDPKVSLPVRSAMLEISLLQDLLASPGRIDYLLLSPRTPLPAPASALESTTTTSLPKEMLGHLGLRLESQRDRSLQIERLLAAYQLNISAMVLMTLFVAVCTIFHSAQLSMLDLREQIAVLRTLGVSRWFIFYGLSLESLLIGGIGAIVGIPASGLLLPALSQLVWGSAIALYGADAGSLSNAALSPTGLSAFWSSTSVITLLLVLTASFLGGVLPAWRASLEVPSLVARRWEQPAATSWFGRGARAIACSALLASLLAAAIFFQSLSLSYVAAFLAVLSIVVLAPHASQLCTSVGSILGMRLGGVPFFVALSNLRASAALSSFAVAASATAIALLSALGIMVFSFRQSLEEWVNYTVRADLFINSRNLGEALPATVLSASSQQVGVEAVLRSHVLEGDCGGRRTPILGTDFLEHPRARSYRVISGKIEPAELAAGTQMLLSESAARKLGLEVGSAIQVQSRAVTIAAIVKDFADERGLCILSLPVFQQLFETQEISTLALYIAPQALADVEQKLRMLLPVEQLDIRRNQELRASIFTIFDETFAITSLMKAALFLITMAGAFSSLLQLAWGRRQELLTLHTLGVKKQEIAAALSIEFVQLACAASILGLPFGVLISYILVGLINPLSFGWTLNWTLRWQDTALPLLAVFCVLAVLAPLLLFLNLSKNLYARMPAHDE